MLREYIEKIELSLDSDVIVFFGMIEPQLNGHLIEVIKKVRTKSKRNRLTLIINSNGGESASIKKIDDEIFSKNIYDEIWMIANERMYSAGTMLSFFADKLFTNTTEYRQAEFGMIDPQLEFNNPYNNPEYASAFLHLQCYNCKFELHDTDKLEDSFTCTPPFGNGCTPPIIKQSINEITSNRYMAFNALINHNLKDEPNKERRAIKLINSLMLNDEYKHNSVILDRYIQEMGLKVHNSDEIKKAITHVSIYTKAVMSNFHPYNGGVAYGNNLNCLIQSKEEIIY